MDFNIYDVLKNNQGGEDTSQFLVLLQNLEKKVFKKFEFVDEKLEKLSDDIKEDKDNIDQLLKWQKIVNEKLVIIFAEIEELKKKIDMILKELKDLQNWKDYIDEQLKE